MDISYFKKAFIAVIFFAFFNIHSSKANSLGFGIESGVGVSYATNLYNYYIQYIESDWKNDLTNYKGESSIPQFSYSPGIFLNYKFNNYLGINISSRFISMGNKLKMKAKGKNSVSERHYYISIPLRLFKVYYFKGLSFSFGPEFFIRLHSSKSTIIDGKKNDKKYNKLLKSGKVGDAFTNFFLGFNFNLDYQIPYTGVIIGIEYGISPYLTRVGKNPGISIVNGGNEAEFVEGIPEGERYIDGTKEKYFVGGWIDDKLVSSFEWMYFNIKIGFDFSVLF